MSDYSVAELLAVAEGWTAAPEPLPVALPPVAPFCADLLCPAIRPWITDISDRMQCPPDYPAAAAVVALGAVIGRQVGIRPKAHDDWTVVPNVWGTVIGRPALLKTPSISEVLRMVQALEIAARFEHETATKDHAAAALVREAQGKEAKQRIAKAVKDEDLARAQAIAAENTDDPPAPARRRYVSQDATVEKLGELLRDNPRGILIYRDELVGWLKSLDQEGREGARAFFLEAWNGAGSFTFDRIGRGTVDIEACCVSLIGAIQPGPLADYFARAVTGGAQDDGLLQRLQLAVWPDPNKTWVNVDRWPDTQARQAARAVFARLDALDPAAIGAKRDADDDIAWLRFTPAAQTEFDGWRADLEGRLREEDMHPAIESHLAKYRSLVPSLALIDHLTDDAPGGAVDVPALRRALRWATYLESHARRVYAPTLSAELFAAIELAKRLPALPNPFTARDVYRNHWRGLDAEGVKRAIQVLLDFHHLREEEVEEERNFGRPTIRYEIHPLLRSGAVGSAAQVAA